MFRAYQPPAEHEDWTDSLINKGLPIVGGVIGGVAGGLAGGAPGAIAGAAGGLGLGQSLAGTLTGRGATGEAKVEQGLATGLKAYELYGKTVKPYTDLQTQEARPGGPAQEYESPYAKQYLGSTKRVAHL